MPRAHPSQIPQSSLQRLLQLAQLGPDWDSYGALPPSREALNTAREFLARVADQVGDTAEAAVTPYTIVPLAGGGVQIEWRGSGKILELEIGSGGALACLLIHGEGEGRRCTEEPSISRDEALRLVVQIVMPEARRKRVRDHRR